MTEIHFSTNAYETAVLYEVKTFTDSQSTQGYL